MCFTVCFSTAVLYAEDAVIDEPEKEVIIEDSIKIKATRGQDGVVSISWKSVSEDALYSVMRAQFAKGTYKSIGSVTGKAGAVSYKDTALGELVRWENRAAPYFADFGFARSAAPPI